MKTTNALFLIVLTATASTLSSVWALPYVQKSIINGVDAGEDEFPYFAILNFVEEGGLCGGSVIAPDMVLTAAHCEPDPTDVVEVDVRDNEGNMITRTCKTWVSHPEYQAIETVEDTRDIFLNDYALCKLNKTVIINESYVKLELNNDVSFPAAGTELIAFGLGISDHSGNFPERLQNVTLTSISTESCNELHFEAFKQLDPTKIEELDAIKDELIDPKVKICTDYSSEKEIGICTGDSGGPLVKRIGQGNGSFVDIQVGITSYNVEKGGKTCALSTFARVSGAMEWVTSTACNTLNSVGSMCKNNKAPKRTKAPKQTKAPKRTKAPKS